MGAAQIFGKWWWLLGLGALFAFATWGHSDRVRGDEQAVTYKATAAVFVSAQPRQSFDTPLPEPGRLTASYAELIKGRDVAERVAAFFSLPEQTSQIQALISTRVVPDTQVIEVAVVAATAEEAERILAGATQAFAALHEEQQLPGQIHVMNTAPAFEVRLPHGSAFAAATLSVLAGVFAAAGIVLLFELKARESLRRTASQDKEPSQLRARAPRAKATNQAS